MRTSALRHQQGEEMRKTTTYVLLGMALLVGAWASFELLGPKTPIPRYASASIGGDFQLSSVDGERKLSDFKGEVVLIYFGFISCPDVCPTSLAVMRQAIDQLSEEQREKVRGLFISVDPERDTVDELNAYTQYFSDRIIGVTGSTEEIDSVVKQYGAYYKFVQLDDSALGYTVDHSARIYLIDPEGQLADILAHDVNPNELHSKILAYL